MKSNQNFFRSLFMKGMRWSFLSTTLISGSGILYYALLSRYLSPEDFGLFSVGLIFTGWFEFFSGAGVSAVIIQEKKVTQEQFSTLFWINIGIGLFFSLFLFICAPFIAGFFKDKNLIPLLYILSAAPLLNGISLLHNNILRREIKIAVSEKIEITSNIVMVITGIYLSVSGFSFISLPLAFVFSRLVSCIGYLRTGARYFIPSFSFCYASVKPLLSLGSYQVFERFFNYIRANVDKFLIGRFLGTEALGYYTLAQKVIEFPLSKINPALNKVLFPYFSRLQDRPKIISTLYSNVITFLTITVTPVLIFVILFSDEIVRVIFDSTYSSIAVLIQILSVLGLMRSFSNIGGNILNALGKFKVGFYWNLFFALILTLILLFAFQYDIDLTNFTLIVFLINFVSFFVWHAIIYRFIQMPYKILITRFLAVSIISFIIVYGLKTLKNQWLNAVPESFMLIVTFGLVTFLTALIAFLFLKNHKNLSIPVWK